MRYHIIALVCLLPSAVLTARVDAANLVPNPNFDSDVSHWSVVSSSGTLTFDGTDGSPNPGSARLVAADVTTVGFAQSDCMVVDASQNFDLSAMVKLNNLDSTGAFVLAYLYPDNACNGNASIGPSFDTSGLAIGTWAYFYSDNQTLTTGTNSARIVLSTGEGALTTPIDVSFDTIRFGPTGTTPVRLQSFGVD